jgi:replication factor C subunit 2/4
MPMSTPMPKDTKNDQKPKGRPGRKKKIDIDTDQDIECENQDINNVVINSERIDTSPIDMKFKGDPTIIVSKISRKKQLDVAKAPNTTWVNKYRPVALKDIIGHEDVKQMLITSIKRGDLPHLLFHGGSGTGKTSAVMALVNQLYGPKKVKDKVLELNASDENGIDVVRNKIIKFASIEVGSSDPDYPSPPFKIIILDEADAMTSEAQTALKKVMETTFNITRFVIICNYESKIIDAIKSRCADFRFKPIPNNQLIERLKAIARSEKMLLDENVYTTITDLCEGDARRAINTLQNLVYIPKAKDAIITQRDVYDIASYVDSNDLKQYWEIIKYGETIDLVKLVTKITNIGYPLPYILQGIKNLILNDTLSDEKKSRVIGHIGLVERMITLGSDNWIQLLSIISHINGIYRNMNVINPEIY